jgi:hypothetical protein
MSTLFIESMTISDNKNNNSDVYLLDRMSPVKTPNSNDSSFLSSLRKSTDNNAFSLSTLDTYNLCNGRISLFFKSVRGLNIPQLYKYLNIAKNEDLLDTIILILNIRDCRGGKGERDLGRICLIWLFINYSDEFIKLLPYLPEYGRWDDLLYLFPNILNLGTNLDFIIQNYDSNITQNDLNKCILNQKKIVNFYVKQLQNDYQNMLNCKPCSLAAKWFVSEKSSLDKKGKIYETVCRNINISNKHFRQKFLSPLRSYLKIVEKFMCSKKWDKIEYNKVPSCAMKKLKKSFLKHDENRFNEWKKVLKQNDPKIAKVNAKQLYPHELIKEMRINMQSDEVCDVQWLVLEDKLKKLGTFDNALCIIDTSSSMHIPNYLPFDCALALGMIISHTSNGPLKNHVLTFAESPQFVEIKEDSLYNRYKQMCDIPWGGSTNLQLIFKLIIDKAKKYNIKKEDLPKTLFIMSDMEFNSVEGYGKITNFQCIDLMFKESGYIRPQIVFWNLNCNSSTHFPISINDNGTALISGFSTDILQYILDGNKFNSYTIMKKAINNPRYNQIREILI